MKPLVAGVTVLREEVRAVVPLVAQVEHAQRNGLPDAFTELFRQDAFWTISYGDPLTGLEEISAFARRALPGTTRQPLTVTYETESIVFIRRLHPPHLPRRVERAKELTSAPRSAAHPRTRPPGTPTPETPADRAPGASSLGQEYRTCTSQPTARAASGSSPAPAGASATPSPKRH